MASDKVLTNSPLTYTTEISDHKLLKVQRYTAIQSFKQYPRYVNKRSFKKFKESEFKNQLKEIKLGKVLQCYDVNEAAEFSD